MRRAFDPGLFSSWIFPFKGNAFVSTLPSILVTMGFNKIHKPISSAAQKEINSQSYVAQQIGSKIFSSVFSLNLTIPTRFFKNFMVNLSALIHLAQSVTNIFEYSNIRIYWSRIYSDIRSCQICLYEYIRTFVGECVRV